MCGSGFPACLPNWRIGNDRSSHLANTTNALLATASNHQVSCRGTIATGFRRKQRGFCQHLPQWPGIVVTK